MFYLIRWIIYQLKLHKTYQFALQKSSSAISLKGSMECLFMLLGKIIKFITEDLILPIK